MKKYMKKYDNSIRGVVLSKLIIPLKMDKVLYKI